MGFLAYVKYLVGIDSERRVSRRTEALAARCLATREIEGQYETNDETDVVFDNWTGRARDGPASSEAAYEEAVNARPYGCSAVQGTRRQPEQSAWNWFQAFQGVPESNPDEVTIEEIFHPPKLVFGTVPDDLDRLETPANADAGIQTEPEVAESVSPKVRSDADRSRISRLASAAAKVKFGLPKCTEANMLVVGKFIRDWLDERGVRPSHIEHIAPIATALVFVPTRADVEARAILASRPVVQAFEAYNATYWSESQPLWWKPSTWFGRAYARPFAG